jgi:hypothetical protein
MSRWSEREIARKLAERDELEPPPGLLERIKSEIPPEIPVGTGVPEIDRQSSMPPRQRWLIAASIVATVGVGLFALHVQKEVPPVEETARTTAGARQPGPPRVFFPPPPNVPAPRSFARPLEKAPASKPPSRKDEKELKSPGSVSSEGRVQGGAPGGVMGGLAGDAPAAPPAPTLAPAPAPPAEVQAPVDMEKKEAAAEAPLRDERRAEKDDRINVGGNESGQQSAFAGPGAVAQEAMKPQAAARAKAAAGIEPFIETEFFRSSTLGTNPGAASYETVRRSLLKGRLPGAGDVRVGEVVNGFMTGDAPPVEGALTPFVHGPRYRLLRFHPSGGGQAQVEFNPAVVARWRLLGNGLSALYEIELRSDAPRDNQVATLRLGETGRAVTLSEVSVPWDKTTPGFRLAALSAQFAELLKSQPADPNALFRLLWYTDHETPKGSRLTDLGDLVKRAALIQVKKR